MIRDQTIHWETKHNFEYGRPRELGQSVRAIQAKSGRLSGQFPHGADR